MWWPWRRRPEPADEEAGRARAEAEQKLAETEARTPEIEEMARRLERIRRQNRFALMIEQALREHR